MKRGFVMSVYLRAGVRFVMVLVGALDVSRLAVGSADVAIVKRREVI